MLTWENGSLEALLHVSEVRIDTWRTSTLGTLTDLRLVRLASAVAHGAHAGRVTDIRLVRLAPPSHMAHMPAA